MRRPPPRAAARGAGRRLAGVEPAWRGPDAGDAEELEAALDALARRDPTAASLLRAYAAAPSRSGLAASLGFTTVALQVRVSRARSLLRALLAERALRTPAIARPLTTVERAPAGKARA